MSVRPPSLSLLHALPPLGTGTADQENLVSYSCRLALSHGSSVGELAKELRARGGWAVRKDTEWYERNLSSMSDASARWSQTVTELNSVPHLDRLTMLPWRGLLAETGLSQPGRWCPDCFREDRLADRPIYFRLAWDIAAVSVCAEHRLALVSACPHCDHSRALAGSHDAVPGWCVGCGGDLCAELPTDGRMQATPEAHWKAVQVGYMLASQGIAGALERGHFAAGLRTLIGAMEDGNSAAFARRIGVGKPTLHGWATGKNVTTLDGALRVAFHAQLPLWRVLSGQIEAWTPPKSMPNLDLNVMFLKQERRPARRHAWELIQETLSHALAEEPQSFSCLAAKLGIDERALRRRYRTEAQAIGRRWRKHQAENRRQNQRDARQLVMDAMRKLAMAGESLHFRKVREVVPADALQSFEQPWATVWEMREEVLKEFSVNDPSAAA